MLELLGDAVEDQVIGLPDHDAHWQAAGLNQEGTGNIRTFGPLKAQVELGVMSRCIKLLVVDVFIDVDHYIRSRSLRVSDLLRAREMVWLWPLLRPASRRQGCLQPNDRLELARIKTIIHNEGS